MADPACPATRDPLDAASARARVAALHALLEPARLYWESAPFRGLPTPWEAEAPALSRWARALDVEQIEALEADPGRLIGEAPEPLATLARAAATLSEVADWPAPARPATLLPRVKARKREQIGGLLAAVDGRLPAGEPLLDWCGGKGHLGRALAGRSGRRVRVVERDPALCRDGAALAGQEGVPGLEFVAADVLSAAGAACLDGAAGALALHACGQLADALIDASVAHRLPWLALAPCCYWRLGDRALHAPLSQAGRATDLRLDRRLLRLACNEERTGPRRTRAERRRHMAWRLGLALLDQEATGADCPRELPDGARTLLRLPFRVFCERATALGLALPARWDPDRAEAAGWERAHLVRALGVVRTPFRRPLELWLCLDRALALAEAGYALGVGTFCPAEISPRNLLILGCRTEA